MIIFYNNYALGIYLVMVAPGRTVVILTIVGMKVEDACREFLARVLAFIQFVNCNEVTECSLTAADESLIHPLSPWQAFCFALKEVTTSNPCAVLALWLLQYVIVPSGK